MTISETLSKLLDERDLKQADLSRMTGIPTSLISNYIKGTKSPSLSNAVALSKAFGVSIDTLAGLTDDAIVKEKQKASESNQIDPEAFSETKAILLDAFVRCGFLKPGNDITPKQEKALIAVVLMLEAVADESDDSSR